MTLGSVVLGITWDIPFMFRDLQVCTWQCSGDHDPNRVVTCNICALIPVLYLCSPLIMIIYGYMLLGKTLTLLGNAAWLWLWYLSDWTDFVFIWTLFFTRIDGIIIQVFLWWQKDILWYLHMSFVKNKALCKCKTMLLRFSSLLL